jgi:hypothetical protein
MVSIRVLRDIFFHGKRVQAGTVLKVSAIEASESVASGRVEYVSESDRQKALDAVREALKNAFKDSGLRTSFWASKRT